MLFWKNPEMSNQATFQAPAGGAGHVQDIFPLSLAQEGLWILDRISPGGAAYNMPESWRLKGKVDIDALRASIGEIVNRHVSLRTVFSQADAKPHQITLLTIAADIHVNN